VNGRAFISTRRSVPVGLDVHLIVDNYGTHKTEPVRKWVPAHPRFHLRFTPTGSSGLNLVGRWSTGTRTPARTYGTRPPSRSSTVSPVTADAST
jgi:hypothetical protein